MVEILHHLKSKNLRKYSSLVTQSGARFPPSTDDWAASGIMFVQDSGHD